MTDDHIADATPAVDPDDSESLFAAFVGRNWNEYYRERFAAFAAGRRPPGSRVNLAALLVPMWFGYRRIWVLQVGAFIGCWVLVAAIMTLLGDSPNVPGWYWYAAIAGAYGVMSVLEGLAANRVLWNRARHALAGARDLAALDPPAARRHMERRGGTHVAMAVVVPLVTFAGGMWINVQVLRNNSPVRAYTVAMRIDLRELAAVEAAHFSAFGAYTPTPRDSFRVPGDSVWRPGFQPSRHVTVSMGNVTATGWNATAGHDRIPITCAIFVGDAPAPIPGAAEGAPSCSPAR